MNARGFIRKLPQYGLPIATVILFAFLSFTAPSFLTGYNIQNISRQVAALAVAAFGQAIVVITAGLDLSVGATMALVSVFFAIGTLKYGMFVGIIIALAIGLVVGFLNGSIVARFDISPFIVTMGMASIARGIALTVTGGTPVHGMSEGFAEIGVGSFLGIPNPILIAIMAFFVCFFMLMYTRLGRHIYAVGGNKEASRLSGVKVDWCTVKVYLICGLLAAVAGIILTSRVRSGQPTLGTGYELQSVAAVVLGGVSLYGGRGNLVGVFFGVLFIGILGNGLNLLNVSSYTQQIVIGIVLILAIVMDSVLLRQEKARKSVTVKQAA
ncbi:MAG: ABC transporter permease [Dethiobacteria bacterium]